MIHLSHLQILNIAQEMGTSSTHELTPSTTAAKVLLENYFEKHQTIASQFSEKQYVYNNMKRRDYQEWQKAVKGVQKYRQYLQLPKRYIWKEDCVCSQYGSLQIYYSQRIYTLSDQIGYRKSAGTFFKESQLWYMLYLIITLQFTTCNEVKQVDYWNIHPDNIIITKQGQIKVLFTLLHPSKQKDLAKRFIPPQEIPHILLQILKTNDERVLMRMNKEISETFQLGFSLLSAASLDLHEKIYQFTPGLKFNIEKFNLSLSLWAQLSKYTTALTSLIANLCSINPVQRLSGPQLWEWIDDHKQFIKKKAAFTFHYLPPKLLNQINHRIKSHQQDLIRRSQFKLSTKISPRQYEQTMMKQSSLKSSMYENKLYGSLHTAGSFIPHYQSSKQ